MLWQKAGNVLLDVDLPMQDNQVIPYLVAVVHENILPETLELLRRDRGNWRDTAEKTGLGYEWLKKLVAEAVGDPGHNKIVKLHAYLVEKYPPEDAAA